MDYNFIIEGNTKFFKNLNDKLYHILVINSKKKLKLMNKKLKEFNNEQSIIALDFEFKKVSKNFKDIALVQLNLENNTKNAYIFIFYPPDLNKKGKHRFSKLLYNKHIKKIIHGGESLDIPYIFDTLLEHNKKKIKHFITNLYDSKFLCEFYHIENQITNKCSIYNLLEELQIINTDTINYLQQLDEQLGEIYLIDFNIDSLTDNLIEYAFYDVIFLPTLLNKFISISYLYNNIISNLTGIIYYNKKIISDKFKLLYDNINKLNNFFFFL